MHYIHMFFNQFIRLTLTGILTLVVVACANHPETPSPVTLEPTPSLIGVRLAWSTQVGLIDSPLQMKAVGSSITVSSSDGQMFAFDIKTGLQLWRVNVGSSIAAGVGSDGRYSAVVSRDNDLVVYDRGSKPWRAHLKAQVFTAPLVAGERIFVSASNGNLSAFDAKTGRVLWSTQQSVETLVLRQAGILLAIGNTLIAGHAGHLVGINPLNGNVIWDVPVALPRGINDIERLVDLMAGDARDSSLVCVRAFQAGIGCVDTQRAVLTWRKAATGNVGLAGDDRQIYGVESDGHLMAWRLSDGEAVWSSDRLRYHALSAPLVVGRSVVVADEAGLVHLVSRVDGTFLARMVTDGSPVVVPPVFADGTLVVATRKGSLFAFQPN